MKKQLISAAVLAVAAVALTLPALASSAAPRPRPKKHKPLPILVHAKPDPLVAAGHQPYVAFALSRATVGRKYRITQQEGPKPQFGVCTSALTTDWMPALKGGVVVFDLQPMRSGKYVDNAGFDPCPGRYVLKVEWRASSTSQPTLRRFSFDYPSFRIAYLPTRPI
jgi:hypothetical protein